MKQADIYRVLVIDDHPMMRAGIKALTETNDTVTIQWFEADNLATAIEQFRKHDNIDLVMLDLNLPDSQGLKSIQRFLAKFPNTPIVVHSATEDEFVVRQALALGVIGFIPKSLPAESMLELLITLLGRLYEPGHPHLSQPMPPPASNGNTTESTKQAHDVLSPTQLKVLELVLAGLSNREIASECHLALGTVKNTVSSIMLALNANSRSHLISMFR